jgi:hypothetical protein
MYELVILLKSGREIVAGRANSQEEATQLAEGASHMLAGIPKAQQENHNIILNFAGAVYWIMPGEIEGLSLYPTDDKAPPLQIQQQQPAQQA